jgi:A nuclease of the HNH/ENDO VII superfamily with conserved WHH
MKIFGEAFNRLKSLLAPNAAPKTPPTFAPQANFSPSPSAASAAFQNVAGYVQNPEAPPSPFVDDLKSVESASREKNRSLVVSAGGKPGLLEADRAFLREMLTQAGVPNPSDAEIRRFKENVRTVTGKPIGVLADDGQVRAAAAADGRIRVDYSDYDAGVIAAGAKDILRQRAATQATAERAHAAGTKYVDEAVGGFYGNQVNAAIDLANLATKIPRSVTGTPGLARVEVTGEYWNQPLRKEAAEIGAGLGLPIGRIGKAGTALIVGATATAGTQAVTGQDVETGRKLTPIERGLNGLGAVGGAAATRTEVGQVVAKTEEAVKRAAGKFPSGGGLAPELVTNEGVTVRVPERAPTANAPKEPPKVSVDRMEARSRPSTVEMVNGRYPINSHYANQKFPLEKLPPEIRVKYPNSVRFDETGFPDFSPYAEKTVKITYSGDRATDFKLANEAANLKRTPEGMTWHHHQDGKTMQLVPTDLHNAVKHTGGVAASDFPY